MQNFDLIIIGAGPGGYPLALRSAASGLKVAIIERDNVGGTCLNWGCIPTKTLLASAKLLSHLKHAADYGLTASGIGFDWAKVQTRKDQVVNKLRQGIHKLLEHAGVRSFQGTGYLTGPKTVMVEGKEQEELTAGKICLAIGSIPAIPGVFPKDRTACWSSDEALSAAGVPKDLLVVGGGVIGLELGQVFSEFGSKVTIVEMVDQILPGLDSATAKRLLPVFKKAGLEILTGQKVEQMKVQADGQVEVVISGQTRTFEKALLAIGRRPNLRVFERFSQKPEMDGPFLKVGKDFQTNIPGVFAIGDCIPGPMLAHKASYDALILSRQWAGEQVVATYDSVPSCVYTYPEISWVGRSEDQLKKEQVAYKIGRSQFSANGKALAMGEGDGQVKTLVSPEGKLLGTIMWGPETSNLILEGTLAQGLDLTGADLVKQVIHPHPTLSEAFLEALENGLGMGVHG